jgi:hypothetical protein
MASSRNSSRTRLYAVAEGQQGLFTARQAVAAGFDRRNHTYHVARGNWVREARGIYRLSRFPRTAESDYSLWTLWSMGESATPKGVFSHETALSIHKLSDALPAKLHMTVPKDFGSRETPAVLVLHRAELSAADVEDRPGYRVTTVLRALLDLAVQGTLSRDLLVQALFQALDRGLITAAQAEGHEPLRELLPDIEKLREAEPLYKLLKLFLKPPPEQERAVRDMAVKLQPGLESFLDWVTSSKPKEALKKFLKLGKS